jgi:hypothetical protein
MKESIATRASGDDASLELGKVLGQSIAFGTIAGRCSAAQAAAIRKVRDDKVHARFGLTWREFCSKHFKMSGAQADLFVRLLEEFGPEYFEHTQFVRISADNYRLVAPFIRDKTLHHGAEVLELNSANVRKVAEAVRAPQRRLPAPAPIAPEEPAAAPEEPAAAPEEPAAAPVFADRLSGLERRIAETVADFREVGRAARQAPPSLVAESQFRGALARMTIELKRVGLENGIV